MAQFQQIALEYLEHYQPATYQELCASRGLRDHLQTLVERLCADADSAVEQLRPLNLEMSDEQLRHYAEQMAIDAVLPIPTDILPADHAKKNETIM